MELNPWTVISIALVADRKGNNRHPKVSQVE
jgi:hypothetical protein